MRCDDLHEIRDEPEDGKGALYFVKPAEPTLEEKLDAIDAETEVSLKTLNRFIFIYMALVVTAPPVGLIIAALIKWWTK